MKEPKVHVKEIIQKLTIDTPSVLSEKIYNVAAEFGLGDMLVHDCLSQLVEENFISEPMQGVLKRR